MTYRTAHVNLHGNARGKFDCLKYLQAPDMSLYTTLTLAYTATI
jgi:hypothetical protein